MLKDSFKKLFNMKIAVQILIDKLHSETTSEKMPN